MTKSWKHGEFQICTVNLPYIDLQYIQKLMDKGITPSRSEYIRAALRRAIEIDMKVMEYKEDIINEKINLAIQGKIKIPGYNGNKPVKIIKRLESIEPVEVKRVYY